YLSGGAVSTPGGPAGQEEGGGRRGLCDPRDCLPFAQSKGELPGPRASLLRRARPRGGEAAARSATRGSRRRGDGGAGPDRCLTSLISNSQEPASAECRRTQIFIGLPIMSIWSDYAV